MLRSKPPPCWPPGSDGDRSAGCTEVAARAGAGTLQQWRSCGASGGRRGGGGAQDQITLEELNVLDKLPHYCPVCAYHEWNLDGLVEMTWQCAPPPRPRGPFPLGPCLCACFLHQDRQTPRFMPQKL